MKKVICDRCGEDITKDYVKPQITTKGNGVVFDMHEACARKWYASAKNPKL